MEKFGLNFGLTVQENIETDFLSSFLVHYTFGVIAFEKGSLSRMQLAEGGSVRVLLIRKPIHFSVVCVSPVNHGVHTRGSLCKNESTLYFEAYSRTKVYKVYSRSFSLIVLPSLFVNCIETMFPVASSTNC